MANNQNFSEKYLKTNFLSNFLLANFFGSIQKIITGLSGIQKVLEVGCGSGFSTFQLAEFFLNKHFEASDIDENLVKEAQQKNPSVKISQESVYDLQRENNSFDLIFCLEVLEHLEKPEIALSELSRVSAKYVLISVPNEPFWRILNMARFKYLKNFGNTPGHLNHWSKKEFASLVSKYFKIKKIATPLPWTIILVER